jgi:hypothetical protein
MIETIGTSLSWGVGFGGTLVVPDATVRRRDVRIETIRFC